jgi:3-oxoacyl-[acyl-carrier protein] reductase
MPNRPRRPCRLFARPAARPWPASATSRRPTSPSASSARPMSEFKGLDIVINNAGYTWDNVIQKMTDEQWYAMLEVHLTAPFRILRAAQPADPRATASAEAEAAAGGAQGGQHLVDGRPVRQRGPGQLCGGQGRHHRHDPDAGQGMGPHERHGELRGLRPHQDAADRQRRRGRHRQHRRARHQGRRQPRDAWPRWSAAFRWAAAARPKRRPARCTCSAFPESDYVSGQTLVCSGGLTGI